MQVWNYCWSWYFDHGVPGNLAASAIAACLATLGIHKWVWRRHIKPHVDKVHEIHAHLDPNHPFTLGGDEHGTSDSGR